jgi:ribonuclease HI
MYSSIFLGPPNSRTLRIYVAARGGRFLGRGSAYAFYNENTDTDHVKYVDGLSTHEAEFRAVRYALRSVPVGSQIKIFSDSRFLVRLFNGKCLTREKRVVKLLAQSQEIIRERQLTVTVKWVVPDDNIANDLL